MFRIASYYGDQISCGRNDGSPLFITGMLRVLFGDGVMHLFPKGDLSRYGVFDWHWLVDWGEDALGYQDFELPHPSIYITSDTHLGYDYRLSRAQRCDFTFCNQKRAVEEFIRDGIPEDRVMWLPHAYDPLAYNKGCFNLSKNIWDEEAVPLKRYDVCFVGNLNDQNRVDWLDTLFKAFPNFYWGTERFHNAAEKFNQSKIVFNISCRDDLNMRVHETLGAGAFLLTNDIPTLHERFTDGVHLVTYKTEEEMIEKARYYLEHDEEREAIARAGCELVRGRDTYMHRTMTILDRVGIPYEKSRAIEYLPKDLKVADGSLEVKEAVCL